jgi:MraZ protein
VFLGRSDHTIDVKGRMFLPARHRSAFERGAYVTKMLDGCLAVWPPEDFERMIADLQEKARRGATERSVLRSMVAGTHDAVPDKQGRVQIPAVLRDWAGLTSEVVVVGGINHLELWNPERWQEKDAEGSQGLISGEDSVADMAF